MAAHRLNPFPRFFMANTLYCTRLFIFHIFDTSILVRIIINPRITISLIYKNMREPFLASVEIITALFDKITLSKVSVLERTGLVTRAALIYGIAPPRSHGTHLKRSRTVESPKTAHNRLWTVGMLSWF